jgi:hypothetical protein
MANGRIVGLQKEAEELKTVMKTLVRYVLEETRREDSRRGLKHKHPMFLLIAFVKRKSEPEVQDYQKKETEPAT